MSDMLQTGMDWLEEQRKSHLSRTVTYRRGALTAEVAATVGETVFEEDDGHGIIIEQQVRDYLVAAVDLVLGGEGIEPKRGDRIEEARGSRTHVYEVSSVGTRPPCEFCDPSGKTLRIHTRQVEVRT